MQNGPLLKSVLAAASILSLLNAPLFGGLCCDDAKVMQEGLNPSARCYPDNGFNVSADFLYWKAGQPDLAYAFVNTDPDVQDIGFLSYIDFEWSPGFRVGLGWNTDYDGWNLNANWTWLRNKSNASVGFVTETTSPIFGPFADLHGVHIPSFLTVTNIDNTTTDVNIAFGSAKASWKMLYNMFGIELSKPYSVSTKLDLTPLIGVQGGWISRRLDLTYDALPFENVQVQANNETKYWGVGPKFGMNTDWKLGNCGFELFGNFATALLYGESFDELLIGEGEDVDDGITSDSNRGRIVPTMQMVLGLGWNKCFNYSCHDYYVNLDAAWEVNYYWNMQNFFQLQGIQAAYNFPSSLDLGGLTLHASFGF